MTPDVARNPYIEQKIIQNLYNLTGPTAESEGVRRRKAKTDDRVSALGKSRAARTI